MTDAAGGTDSLAADSTPSVTSRLEAACGLGGRSSMLDSLNGERGNAVIVGQILSLSAIP